MEKTNFKNLKKQYQKLLLRAEKAMRTAYSPYSNFAVGAAILTSNNKIITGSNVENASAGLTICAERTAIARANAMGERCFKAIAIVGAGDDSSVRDSISPCGSCRQVLYEFSQFSKIDTDVIMSNTDKNKIIIAKLSELLPLPFGPKDLGE